MASLLVLCPYCEKVVGSDEITHEHLVPRSWGGCHTILTCRSCNGERGTSFRYAPFLRFVRKSPDLFRAHVESSRATPEQKEFMTNLVDIRLPERADVDWYQMLCKEMLEKMRAKEAHKQIHALRMARDGTPVSGGRAEAAIKKSRKRGNRNKKK